MSYDTEHNVNREDEELRYRERRLSGHVREILESLGLMENPLPEGMRQDFVDGLDRVAKKEVKPEDTCPICTIPFLEDPYPLVVSVPCPGNHRFDLDCVAKWLQSSGTCPMCRYDFNEKQNEKAIAVNDDDEEEYDDMYA